MTEEAGDALHAQIVSVLAGTEVARMSDADKQKYWEFCLGFPTFVIGMKEVATEPSSQEDLRKVAAAGFESLIGVNPNLVDLGPQGMVVRAGLEDAVRRVKEDEAAAANPAPPASGPGVSGITYTPPPGWERENASRATVFRATLVDVDDNGAPHRGRSNSGSHHASIFVMPPRAMTKDAQTTFDALWREQFDTFELSDTVVHYRGRVKSGLVVHYMGRFFERKARTGNSHMVYGVLYLVDLGGGKIQPITAIVEPSTPSNGVGTDGYKESFAYGALSWPIFALLDSIQPAGGRAPYPAGGYFAASDLQGNWGKSSSGVGGSYVNTSTGASAGIATNASGGSFRLGADGTYDYSFAFSSTNPRFGDRAGSAKHNGRYRLDGDVVLRQPSQPVKSLVTLCAVGIGTRQTREGVRRILVTVPAGIDGVFRGPSIFPNWDSYAGAMSWYVEE